MDQLAPRTTAGAGGTDTEAGANARLGSARARGDGSGRAFFSACETGAPERADDPLALALVGDGRALISDARGGLLGDVA